MKTSLKTLVASTMTAIILSATVFSSIAAEKIVAIEKISAKEDIKRVVIQGNTKVFLVQSSTEWVSVEDQDLSAVSVKQFGNTLTVSSSEEKPVTVTIYVKDPYRIYASNDVEVRTIGTFKLKYLQLILRDNAVAHIKANTENLYTDMDGQANLVLLGSTESHIIKNAGIGCLKMDKFAALKTENMPVESRLAMSIKGKEARKANMGSAKK